MKTIIAHRGLLEGPNKELENRPDQLLKALQYGFDIEVDVWYNDDGLFLGHDEPQYPIDGHIRSFVFGRRAWVHAKNIETMVHLMNNFKSSNVFYHTDENVVLTSKGYMWAHPIYRIEHAVCVLPELYPDMPIPGNAFGICTDYALKYSETHT